jgi:hypothetical protein
LEAKKPIIIQLKKVYSWKTTYHKYPFYLASADPDRTYRYDEVFTDIFRTGTAPVKRGKGQFGWVKAVFGLDVDTFNQQVLVEGIGLIKKIGSDQYRLSNLAIELGQSYAHDPAGINWRKIFAEVIAQFDVRTRMILYYMGILNYGLRFPDMDNYSSFGKSLINGRLVSSGGNIDILAEVPPDEQTYQGRIYIFNQLLDRYRFEILGPFLRFEIESYGLDFSGGLEYQGARIIHGHGTRENLEPSTNELGSYLSQSLALFVDLGVIIFDPIRKIWVINYAKSRELFDQEIIQDLFIDRREELFEDLLRQSYSQMHDVEGFASVRILRGIICNHLQIPTGESIRYFNRQVARLISIGRISIGKHMGWRASADDALFGDRSMEFVEFLF